MPDRLAIAIIDLGAYTHNLETLLGGLQPGVKLLAVVKANAYGHGIEKIAEAAVRTGASYLGVVSLGELRQLRDAGITAPVLILNYLDPASVPDALKLNGSLTIMDEHVLDAVEQTASKLGIRAKVHIKIDTGMHRAGCDPKDFVKLAERAASAPHVELEGAFTHFAESEALDTSFTQQQLEIFQGCIEDLSSKNIRPPLIHAANSAAIITLPRAHFSLVRPGLITYGLNPFGTDHPKYSFVKENFKPVLSLKTQVIFVRTLERGETVGYNRRWRATRRSTVALLPIGYGDGFRRSPQNAGKVLVHGKSAPILGSVAMDQTIVDVTDIGKVSVGDEVVIIGEQSGSTISTDDVANAYDTINYEVVTALASRITREYID